MLPLAYFASAHHDAFKLLASGKKTIDRRDFKVKLSTKVCSNHFKSGYRSKEIFSQSPKLLCDILTENTLLPRH